MKLKDSVSNAKYHAFRLIRYRDRSEKEMSERLLLKGFSQKTVSDTIKALKESGLIDDISLAGSLEEIAKDVKFLGNLGTEFFLKKRGISDTVIAEMSISASDELERAVNLSLKKRKSLAGYPLKEQIKKMRGLLGRRGYSFDTINRVINTIRKERGD